MPDVVVDSNVLFGYRSARDQYHAPATEIVEGMDHGSLPRGFVTNYVLQVLLNPLSKLAGHEHAVGTLDFVSESKGLRVRHLGRADFLAGEALFRATPGVELTDCITVAFMRRSGVEYIYSFDDDFDRFGTITRLNAAVDPYEVSG